MNLTYGSMNASYCGWLNCFELTYSNTSGMLSLVLNDRRREI